MERPKKVAKQPEITRNLKIGEIRIFLLAFIFQTSSPNAEILGILGKEVPIFQPFNEILPVPYFENADFKSGIGFQKF